VSGVGQPSSVPQARGRRPVVAVTAALRRCWLRSPSATAAGGTDARAGAHRLGQAALYIALEEQAALLRERMLAQPELSWSECEVHALPHWRLVTPQLATGGLLCGLRHVRHGAQAQAQVGCRSTWSLQRLDALAEEVRSEFASAQGDQGAAGDGDLSQYPVAALAAINRVLYVPPVGGYSDTEPSS